MIIEKLRAMRSAKIRGVLPAGRGMSGSAVRDISAAHSTLVNNFVIRLQAMRSAKPTPVALHMKHVAGQHGQH